MREVGVALCAAEEALPAEVLQEGAAHDQQWKSGREVEEWKSGRATSTEGKSSLSNFFVFQLLCTPQVLVLLDLFLLRSRRRSCFCFLQSKKLAEL